MAHGSENRNRSALFDRDNEVIKQESYSEMY
jgi:hypothetical protein